MLREGMANQNLRSDPGLNAVDENHATLSEASFSAVSRELSGVRLGAGCRARLAPPQEIETRYFAELTSLKNHLDLARIEPRHVIQHYFPGHLVSDLLRQLELHKHFKDTDKITSARLRRETQGGGSSYSIEFKSPKTGGRLGKVSRIEIGIPLSSELYDRILRRCSAGMLEKLRYEVQGTVLDERAGCSLPLTAQVDVLVKAGRNGQRIAANFATIDIELSSKHLLR